VTDLYVNGRVFTADPDPSQAWAQAFAIDGDAIAYVGDEHGAPAADRVIDLEGRLVLPGFTDADTHLLMMGAALGQVHLTDARSLDEIQARLRAARAAAPDAP
jgi:predicted amidohydrolase YtcJ